MIHRKKAKGEDKMTEWSKKGKWIVTAAIALLLCILLDPSEAAASEATDVEYTIYPQEVSHGTMEVEHDYEYEYLKCAEGNAVDVMVTPDDGYYVSAIQVTDSAGTILNSVSNSEDISFQMPAKDVYIKATVKAQTLIKKVEITNARLAFGAGDRIYFGGTVASSAKYKISYEYWSNDTDETYVYSNQTDLGQSPPDGEFRVFQKGKSYSYDIELETKHPKYAFSTKVAVTVNGTLKFTVKNSRKNRFLSLDNVAVLKLPKNIALHSVPVDLGVSGKSQTYQLSSLISGKSKTYTSDNSQVKVSKNGIARIPKSFVGTAIITIKAVSGGKKVSKIVILSVKPKSTSISKLSAAKGKKMKIKWRTRSNVTGYQIQYSTSSRFSSGNHLVRISGSKANSKTIAKLKKKKTYYVRVRTYKTNSKRTLYSSWSKSKKVKIKK